MALVKEISRPAVLPDGAGDQLQFAGGEEPEPVSHSYLVRFLRGKQNVRAAKRDLLRPDASGIALVGG